MIRLEHLRADVLDLSPMARDVVSGRFDPTLLPVPRKIDALDQPRDRFEREEREMLSETLETHLARLAPHVAVLDGARALARHGSFAVVTGQQPGFLASPLYSLYKALQAIRLARTLTERWETRVVPLFWNHADDHDVAEVHHAHVVNVNLDLQKISLAGMSSTRQPLSRLVISHETQRLAVARAALEAAVESGTHTERALELFMPRDGETFAHAFTRSMTELLGPLGLVVLEPDWIRASMSAQLAPLIAADPAVHLAQGARDVARRGYPIAIEPETAALVFRHDARGRLALRSGGEGFRYDGEEGSRTPAELAAEIVQAPFDWSPGALLRPLVQDACLPVAAYVGGFGELAYHAELGPLRAAVGAPRTPFVPRISCTLVDPESRVALTRVEARVEDVITARGSFASAIAPSEAPAVVARMRAIAKQAKRDLATLDPELEALDPGLSVLLKRTGEQVVTTVDKLIEKTERVHQNKTGKGKRHERRLNNALFPKNTPQERVLGPFTYVARFGEEWIRELCDEIDPFAAEHLVVHLGADLSAGETT